MLKQNTTITEQVADLTKRIDELTRDIHGKLLA
jgi:hypothetical protein